MRQLRRMQRPCNVVLLYCLGATVGRVPTEIGTSPVKKKGGYDVRLLARWLLARAWP
jgi:hypothetical protein